jgi:hypothetical protein
MGLQDQRSALDGGGIGAFAAFGEALFDEALRISEQRNALAGVAPPAGVVSEAFTICSLGEEAGERVFANATRSGEEQSVGDAAGLERAAKRRNDLRIAAKFAEGHG